MSWLYCVDDRGLDGLLTLGQLYEVRKLQALTAVEVTLEDGATIICCGTRFAEEVDA